MMKNKRPSRRDKKEIKVTYISSPVKVKTSASNFRAIVQELTGQDSNVAETSMPIEANGSERVHNVAQGYYLPEATLLKPDYSEFLSRSLMEPFNQQLQYDLWSFDMS
ncbi:uncharacterized protein LOC133306046 [Gastrolobium bilobum]|uniref:uncharacterized protein LOC133306046 n=1 Tax=Gastrolobium bilobum TaxID=150636 RepID=UPI002AB14D27|nr:uncharacterized protein LOC133306046 [Gastrolobium bilobum]